MKARVYLATTAGPVRIERLTRERAQQSAVCLGRTTKVLAVSADYDAFVRQPSGVIEREFGPMEPGAFRLDVDGPVDDGDSWQLGVFAAHMLARDNALAGPVEPGDRAIWLTGAVHNDLAVAPVDHIPEKLQASRELFAALVAEGMPVKLVLPAGGRRHAEAVDLTAGFDIAEIASTSELTAIFGMDKPLLTSGPRPDNPAKAESGGGGRRTGKMIVGLVALFLLLVVAIQAWQVWRAYEELRQVADGSGLEELASALETADRSGWIGGVAADLLQRELRAGLPSARDAVLEIREWRSPEGRSCAAVHFGNVEPVLVVVGPDQDGAYPPSDRNGLCGLEFSMSIDPDRFHALVRFTVVSGKFIREGGIVDTDSGSLVFSGNASWVMDLPRRPDGPFAYQITLVAARRPVSLDIMGKYGLKTADDLAGLGVLYRTIEHRVQR